MSLSLYSGLSPANRTGLPLHDFSDLPGAVQQILFTGFLEAQEPCLREFLDVFFLLLVREKWSGEKLCSPLLCQVSRSQGLGVILLLDFVF